MALATMNSSHNNSTWNVVPAESFGAGTDLDDNDDGDPCNVGRAQADDVYLSLSR